MRGVWRHHNCKTWNLYIGRNDVKRVDTRCRGCGKRCHFAPITQEHRSKRGRPSSVAFLRRPEHMPRHALEKEVCARNGHVPHEAIMHFQKLSEISEFMPGSDLHGWHLRDSRPKWKR